MIIIKLGGSVITHKNRYASFNRDMMYSITEELARNSVEPMIIVHGAGSFGHILAKKYSLKIPKNGIPISKGMTEVQRDVRELNLHVIRILIQLGLPSVSIPPSVCMELDDGNLCDFNGEIFTKYIDLGTIPTTFGDVVPDRTRRVSILSGDTIMERLAQEFNPEKVIFVLNVDGFFDKPPGEGGCKLYNELTVDELARIISCEPISSKDMSTVVDITGSIRGKMESALRIARSGTDTYLVNGCVQGRITDILKNRPTRSTIIKGVAQ